MAAISSVQRMGWPVSASTLAAASRALRCWLPESGGGAARVFGALVALAVFVAGVLAGFCFLVAMMLLLNAGYQTSTATVAVLERTELPRGLSSNQGNPAWNSGFSWRYPRRQVT